MADSKVKYEALGTTDVLVQQPVSEQPHNGHTSDEQVVETKVEVQKASFGRDPQKAYCLTCGKEVITEVKYEMGVVAWALVIVLFFCCLCLSCIPCCVDGIKDAHHFCPICKSSLGRCDVLSKSEENTEVVTKTEVVAEGEQK